MLSPRTKILQSVKRGLGRNREDQDIDKAFAELISHPVSKPALDSEDVLKRFITHAKISSANVFSFKSLSDAMDHLTEELQSQSVTPNIVHSPSADNFIGLNPDLPISAEISSENCWGICQAWAAIAETGTVVSTTHDNSAGLLFLVERLIMIVYAKDILAAQEDVWRAMRQRFKNTLPRTINLITGPSRTADVEQTLQLGAHGPRRVDYFIILEKTVGSRR